jgi:hypothetical protein
MAKTKVAWATKPTYTKQPLLNNLLFRFFHNYQYSDYAGWEDELKSITNKNINYYDLEKFCGLSKLFKIVQYLLCQSNEFDWTKDEISFCDFQF